MSELETLQKTVRDLTGYVQTIAKAVLAKADEDEDEDDYKKEDKAVVSKRGMYKNEGMEDPMAPPMPGMEDDMGYGEDEDEMGMGGPPADPMEDEMAMAYKALTVAKARIAKINKAKINRANKMRKGFAGSAAVNSDEHDAPFDEKDAAVDANEPSPAGDQGGDPEDETFGPGGESSRSYGGGTYKALQSQVAKMARQLEAMNDGQVIAKSIVPAIGDRKAPAQGQLITREVQEQVKSLSYKQLNKFREDTGDLPRHGLIG